MLIVFILFVSYIMEVVKGQRSLSYLFVFMLVTAVPAIIVLILYLKQPDRYSLRYTIVGGYFIMYIFVMITGSTTMVFSYILPMLSLLVLFHQPIIILVTGICATILNLISIFLRYNRGEITTENSKDIEIQLALLFLCFLGSYLATRLYDEIHKTNEKYNKELSERNKDIERMTMQTITTIANTIDAKDEYTRGHSKRVAEYSATIAAELGMSDVEVSNIRIIGLLHDIGKIGIPDSVLNKPGKLTNEEFQIMKGHTLAGAEILKDIDMIPGLEIGAKYHHERID
ncbi:MAG: HD domain-containing protein, partial [Lachnospiraceae bacterium]|nr:HD domain-containing protein [Lachnospiraceae bacterium]